MKHYKNTKNEIFAFEPDGSQDHLIRADLVPVTATELAILRAPTAAQIAENARLATLAELAAIDLASIRALREYIDSKADAPQLLKDRESAAQAARSKL